MLRARADRSRLPSQRAVQRPRRDVGCPLRGRAEAAHRGQAHRAPQPVRVHRPGDPRHAPLAACAYGRLPLVLQALADDPAARRCPSVRGGVPQCQTHSDTSCRAERSMRGLRTRGVTARTADGSGAGSAKGGSCATHCARTAAGWRSASTTSCPGMWLPSACTTRPMWRRCARIATKCGMEKPHSDAARGIGGMRSSDAKMGGVSLFWRACRGAVEGHGIKNPSGALRMRFLNAKNAVSEGCARFR